MKQKYLPSGRPANDDRVGDVIRLGRNLMPAIPDLDDIEMKDLLAYLHTL